MADDGWIFDRCGGNLALDFANTVNERPSDAPIERLTSFSDIAAFLTQSGVIDEAEASRRVRWAKRHPTEADVVHRDALALREAIYAMFWALARGVPVPAEALQEWNRWLHRLAFDAALNWTWAGGEQAPDALLLPVVEAAVVLARASDRDRVHVCVNDKCAWLFVDSSKNKSRRWCDMKSCGNRSKVRRFAERHAR